MDVTAYQKQLVALSPQGLAWNTEKGSDYKKLLTTFAEGLSRADNYIETYFDELDPRTATSLLPEWERLLALPDSCTISEQTLQQRREAAHAKYIMRGGQSEVYFIAIAKALGYQITITTYRPFIAGMSRCGDNLNPDTMRFIWRVNVPGNKTLYFKTGTSSAGEKLLKIASATELECMFSRLKPAHTDLFFNYE
jgi:uncharacterized protein YmfQ (DUF2313 family)